MAEQTWRDQLQPATFRGVAFNVLLVDGQLGRRNVVHEYPLRDLPYAEDLGRKAREFTLDAFVIGADYMPARDKLIEAIEKPGSGELVHPYRGRLQVVVVSARVSESTQEGGLARFQITFVESGEALNPEPRTDTKTTVNTAADNAQVASEASFAKLFSITGFQDFVEIESLTTLNNSLNSIRLAANSGLTNAIMPDFLFELTGVSNSLASLIRTPVNLASGLSGLIKSLPSIANNPLTALASLRSLFGFTSTGNSFTTTTPSRTQTTSNQTATINLVRQSAIIEAAKVATTLTPASFDEAIALRDEIAGQLETQSATTDDALYSALTDLRVAVIQDLNTRAADLERVINYFNPATMPALVVAYQLYGNMSRLDDLIARNHVRHPGFVPGGRVLEILK